MAIPQKTISLSFKDLSITPRIAKLPNSEVDITSKAVGGISLKLPFISSPMDTVTNSAVAIEMARHGALGILHSNYSQYDLKNEIKEVFDCKQYSEKIATLHENRLAVGLLVPTNISMNALMAFVDIGIKIIAIDSLHVSPHYTFGLIERIKKNCPEILIISGNIVHPEDASTMINCGADALRVGYSAASVNRGHEIYGVGASQVNAIIRCSKVARKHQIPLIADGGMTNSADIAIAFALGASSVMSGRLFASSSEAPGSISYQNGKQVKTYSGMSRPGLIDHDLIPEAKQTPIEIDGTVRSLLDRYSSCLKGSIARAGCVNLESFFHRAEISILSQEAILSQL